MTEAKLSPAEAQALAEATAEAMYARDQAAHALAIKIVRVQPGASLLTMAVRSDMVNGHHICHGGMIFTLADTAFAYACNSYNKNAVAAGCSIEFLKPGQEGDVLTCEGVEQTLSGRHGIYDMKVINQKGEVIAMFRGKSAVIPGQVFPEEVTA